MKSEAAGQSKREIRAIIQSATTGTKMELAFSRTMAGAAAAGNLVEMALYDCVRLDRETWDFVHTLRRTGMWDRPPVVEISVGALFETRWFEERLVPCLEGVKVV